MIARMWLLLRNILWIAVFPGIVTGFIPYLILGPVNFPAISEWTLQQFLATLLYICGLAVLLSCVWAFASVGKGTLAPVDETELLVVEGLHRYVRNPMYIGVAIMLLGETWFFLSRGMLMYTAGFFVLANAVVIFYEENRLRHKFGKEYQDYKNHVGRWIPGQPYKRNPKPVEDP